MKSYLPGAIFGGLVFASACAFGLGELLLSDHDQYVRDHAFEIGSGVGYTIGQCDDLQKMRDDALDTEWSRSTTTVNALATCAEFKKRYGDKTYSEILRQ